MSSIYINLTSPYLETRGTRSHYYLLCFIIFLVHERPPLFIKHKLYLHSHIPGNYSSGSYRRKVHVAITGAV